MRRYGQLHLLLRLIGWQSIRRTPHSPSARTTHPRGFFFDGHSATMPRMGDSHFNISITQGTVVKVVVIGVLAWALYLILDVVLIVLTAIVIASAIEPAVRFLMRRRAPRTIAVLVVYMILLTLFFGIFYLFVPSILEDFAKFVSSLPSYLETVSTYGTFI